MSVVQRRYEVERIEHELARLRRKLAMVEMIDQYMATADHNVDSQPPQPQPQELTEEDIQTKLSQLQKQLDKVDRRTYSRAHRTVAQLRGSASQRECVDCGGNAVHWSCDNSDPNEHSFSKGHCNASSTDPFHYQPRCEPCHRKFDSLEARIRVLLKASIPVVIKYLSADLRLADHLVRVHLHDLDQALRHALRDQIILDLVAAQQQARSS